MSTTKLLASLVISTVTASSELRVPQNLRDSVLDVTKQIHTKKLDSMLAKARTSQLNAVDATLATTSVTDGYLTGEFFMGNDCKEPYSFSGQQMGTCWSEGLSSYKYSCSFDDSGSGVLTTMYYAASTSCSGTPTNTVEDGDMGCENSEGFSSRFNCTTSDSPWLNLPSAVVYQEYDDAAECAGGSINDAITYYGLYQDLCYSGSDFSVQFSCTSTMSKFKMFDKSKCKGSGTDYSFPLEDCASVDDDYDDDGPDIVAETEYCSTTTVPLSTGNKNNDDDSSSCFAADSKVLLENGRLVSIADIKVSDRVLTVDAKGTQVYADVIFVPHKTNSDPATFVTLKTAAGSTLRATSEHLVLAGDCSAAIDAMNYVMAEDVAIGSCLVSSHGVKEVVQFSSKSAGEGVYTIVTSEPSGRVVVDGLVASSFAVNHDMANIFYSLHRAAYALLTTSGSSPMYFLGNDFVVGGTSAVGNLAVGAKKLLSRF